LPGEWGDAVDVGNVDRENGLLVPSKAGPAGYDLGCDDIRVSFILCAKWCGIDVGVRVTWRDVKPGRVVVAFGRGRAVVGRLSLEHATIVKKINCEWHFRKSPTYHSIHRNLA
jgi:hypothetical protein